MDWDDPAQRAKLIEAVYRGPIKLPQFGPAEYNRQHAAHMADSVVSTVNGHPIRPVMSRFGRLYSVGATGNAYKDLKDAEAFAARAPRGDPKLAES